MKKIIFLSALFFTATVAKTYAQDTQPESQQKKEWALAEGKKSRDSIINALDLTKEQGQKLRDLVQDGKTQREQIWSDNTLSDEQKKQKITTIRADGRKKLGSILSKEQQEKLQRLHHKANGKYSRQKDATDQLLDPVE